MAVRSTACRTGSLMAAVASLATAAILAVSVPESESPRSAGLSNPGIQAATSPSKPPHRHVDGSHRVRHAHHLRSWADRRGHCRAATTGPFQPAGLEPVPGRLPLDGTARLVRRQISGGGTLPVPDGVGDAAWWGLELNAGTGGPPYAGGVIPAESVFAPCVADPRRDGSGTQPGTTRRSLDRLSGKSR